MQWKFTGEKPVYQQIAEYIRCAILAGEYPPGSRIPAVRELAMMANVNPNTMQRAMTELEREGILVCCGTMGRFVTDDEAVLERVRQAERIAVVKSCRAKLAAVGMTLREAAQLLDEEESL